MRTFTQYSDPDDFNDYMDQCRKAYRTITERWQDYDAAMHPSDSHLAYARSSQMWQDCEEGERLFTLEDFQMAYEFKAYMDNDASGRDDAAWFSLMDRELCNFAGCHG